MIVKSLILSAAIADAAFLGFLKEIGEVCEATVKIVDAEIKGKDSTIHKQRAKENLQRAGSHCETMGKDITKGVENVSKEVAKGAEVALDATIKGADVALDATVKASKIAARETVQAAKATAEVCKEIGEPIVKDTIRESHKFVKEAGKFCKEEIGASLVEGYDRASRFVGEEAIVPLVSEISPEHGVRAAKGLQVHGEKTRNLSRKLRGNYTSATTAHTSSASSSVAASHSGEVGSSTTSTTAHPMSPTATHATAGPAEEDAIYTTVDDHVVDDETTHDYIDEGDSSGWTGDWSGWTGDDSWHASSGHGDWHGWSDYWSGWTRHVVGDPHHDDQPSEHWH